MSANENDRELLELAAKAAGFAEIDFLSQDHWANVYDAENRQSAWNPLADDGDALRLAIQLNMNIEITDGGWVYACGDFGNCSEPSGDDKSAATRRAIVRAAAEVARAKG